MKRSAAHLDAISQNVKIAISKKLANLKVATISSTSDEYYESKSEYITT